MSWYSNRKRRGEAKPPVVETSQEEADHLREKALAMREDRDAVKGARAARKRERKLARRGTGGPS